MGIPINKFHHHLYTVNTFGKFNVFIHDGVMGSGKTTSTAMGLGRMCLALKMMGFQSIPFLLTGYSRESIENAMGYSLSKLFDRDFDYTQSKKDDGKNKDAKLFGQNLIIKGAGTADLKPEKAFRGMPEVFGIIHDECTLTSPDVYKYLHGRRRFNNPELAEAIRNLKPGTFEYEVLNGVKPAFYIGSCNPDTPDHFIKKLIDSKAVHNLHWTMNDACYPTANAYFENLLQVYPEGSLHYNRYILGEWTGAEGMVFSSFDESKNVIKSSDGEYIREVIYSDFDRFIIGIDYGSTHPTAIELIGVSGDTYIVTENHEFKSTDINVIIDKIYSIIDMVREEGGRLTAIYSDYAGGGKAIYDTCNSEVKGLFINPDKGNTSASIAHINSLFYLQKLYIMDNCKSLISNINSYIYKKNTVKDEVVKLNDDHCDAMRYAVYTDSQRNRR